MTRQSRAQEGVHVPALLPLTMIPPVVRFICRVKQPAGSLDVALNLCHLQSRHKSLWPLFKVMGSREKVQQVKHSQWGTDPQGVVFSWQETLAHRSRGKRRQNHPPKKEEMGGRKEDKVWKLVWSIFHEKLKERTKERKKWRRECCRGSHKENRCFIVFFTRYRRWDVRMEEEIYDTDFEMYITYRRESLTLQSPLIMKQQALL